MKLLEIKSDVFLFGGCGDFATALQDKIGGEIWILLDKGKPLHAFVKKDSKNFDAIGQRSIVTMALSFLGRATGITAEKAGDKIPFKTSPKMIEKSKKYIEDNWKLYDKH